MSVTGALYRKYRPQNFAEVRDQDHIVKVLEGAIKKGEIPHAMLFQGLEVLVKPRLQEFLLKQLVPLI